MFIIVEFDLFTSMKVSLETICRRADYYHIRISAVIQRKSSYFVLVKMSTPTGTLFNSVFVRVTTLQSMKKQNFSTLIILLLNNDLRGVQIVASETVIDMDSEF